MTIRRNGRWKKSWLGGEVIQAPTVTVPRAPTNLRRATKGVNYEVALIHSLAHRAKRQESLKNVTHPALTLLDSLTRPSADGLDSFLEAPWIPCGVILYFPLAYTPGILASSVETANAAL